MSDAPTQPPSITPAKLNKVNLVALQRMQNIMGFPDLDSALAELFSVYGSVIGHMPNTDIGEPMLTRLSEMAWLYEQAEVAAKQGLNLAVVIQLPSEDDIDNYEVDSPFLPESLQKVRDKAIRDATVKAERLQKIRLEVANDSNPPL